MYTSALRDITLLGITHLEGIAKSHVEHCSEANDDDLKEVREEIQALRKCLEILEENTFKG